MSTATSAKHTKEPTRSLSVIARDIVRTWKPEVHPWAKPYVNAMGTLHSIKDNFYADTAQDVVLRFLVNAASWRGEDARRIKAELKKQLRENGYPVK